MKVACAFELTTTATPEQVLEWLRYHLEVSSKISPDNPLINQPLDIKGLKVEFPDEPELPF